MFYSYELLCLKKKGKYSIIWYCATHGAPPRKAKIFDVAIVNTCNELIETARLPRESPRRMSLYLSSMLMHGICIAYRSQLNATISEFMIYQERLFSYSSKQLTSVMKDLDGKKAKKPRDDPEEGGRRRVSRKRPAVPLWPDASPPPPALDMEAMRAMLAKRATPPAQGKRQGEDGAGTSMQIDALLQEPITREQEDVLTFGISDPISLDWMIQERRPERLSVLEEPRAVTAPGPLPPLPEDEAMAGPPPTPPPPSSPSPLPPTVRDALPGHSATVEMPPAPQEADVEEPQLPDIPEIIIHPATPIVPERIQSLVSSVHEEERPKRKEKRKFFPIYQTDNPRRFSARFFAERDLPCRVDRALDDVFEIVAPPMDYLEGMHLFDDLRQKAECRGKRKLRVPAVESRQRSAEVFRDPRASGSSHRLTEVRHSNVEEALGKIPEIAEAAGIDVIVPMEGAEKAAPELATAAEVALAPMPLEEPVPMPMEESMLMPTEEPAPPMPVPAPGRVVEDAQLPVEAGPSSPSRSLISLEPRTNWEEARNAVLTLLHGFWKSECDEITFALLCPPGKVTKMKAAKTFGVLLELQKEKIVEMTQIVPNGKITIILSHSLLQQFSDAASPDGEQK